MIVRAIEVVDWSLPLVAPFRVAKRTAHEAKNVLVKIHSNCGECGVGAAAPVEYITGETQDGVIDSINSIVPSIIGQTVDQITPLVEHIGRLLPNVPSARAALEMAAYDLWAKRWQIPLWQYFGGSASSLMTDITVPIVPADEARVIVKRSLAEGFCCFKIKIGDSGGLDADLARIQAVVDCAPNAPLRIDANQAFSPEDAVSFVAEALKISSDVQMIEQPVRRDDYEGLKYVRARIDIPLFADESVRTYTEAKTLIRLEAVDGINIKLMKSGISDAVDIAALCRRNGIRLMVGCMLESQLGIAAAAAVSAGSGGFEFYDIDSHVLLKPVKSLAGEFVADGPNITLASHQAGWGVTVVESEPGTNDLT